MPGRPWTLEEDQILIDCYAVEGYDCFKKIPQRTVKACSARVSALGLKYDKDAHVLPDGTVKVRCKRGVRQLEPGMHCGHLELIFPAEERTRAGTLLWRCRCACGNETLVRAIDLRNENIKSCGCKSRELKHKYWNSESGQTQRAQMKKELEYKLGRTCGTEALRLLLSRPTVRSTTGVRGVYWSARKGKFVASITFKRKYYHLGNFDSIEDAIKVRKAAEEELRPELEAILQKSREDLKAIQQDEQQNEQ